MKKDDIIALADDGTLSFVDIAERVGSTVRYVRMVIRGVSKKKTIQKKPTTIEEDREISRLKAAMGELNKKYKASLEESNFERRLLSLLDNRIVALPPAPFRGIAVPQDQQKEEEYILLISDSHAGEVVSSIQTLGIGGYDFGIFAYRVQMIRDALMSLHTKCLKRRPKKLHVIFNGDIVSGEIHDELMQTNDAPISMVVVETAYVFAQFLRELSTVYPEISVICLSASNHPRFSKTKPFKNKFSNWDYIVHKMLQSYCADIENISINVPKSMHWIEKINGKNYLILHGDSIQSWMGIPWYGIGRMIHKLKSLYAPQGTIIDNVLLGHFHTPGSIADVSGEIIINGSFKGADEFSIGKIGTATVPAQWYFGTDPKRGLTSRYLINISGQGKSDYTYDIAT